jgi:hypothetical protein
MANEKLEAFTAELKELLEKYNATIDCNIDGDTHGLICEMRVALLENGRWDDYFLSVGASVDWNDL